MLASVPGNLGNDTGLKKHNWYQIQNKPGYRPIAIYRKNKNIETSTPLPSTEITLPQTPCHHWEAWGSTG